MSDAFPRSFRPRIGSALTPVALAVLLGACDVDAPGVDGAAAPPQAAPARVAPSPSAAQLANDQTTTLRDAIALASGDELDVDPTPVTAPAPALGAAFAGEELATAFVNPLTVLPEPTSEALSTPEEGTAAESTSEPDGAGAPAAGPEERDASDADATPAGTKPEPNESATAPAPDGTDDSGSEAAEPQTSAPSANPEPAEAAPSGSTAEAPAESAEAAPGSTPDTASATSDADGDAPREFTSARTPGFRGEVLDDGRVRVTWPGDPSHRGYNVYRQSEFLTSVSAAEFVDEDVYDGDYYYEIQAYHYDDSIPQEYVAKGLTVQVRGTGRVDPDAPAPNQELLDGYELVFADEFDEGRLDATKWNTAFLWGPDLTINSEVQYYVDILREPDFGYDPFSFENGNLVISAIETPEHLREKANGMDYLSGILTTYDSLQFTYGYAEVRARVPYGTGYWPAFWLLNAVYDGPDPEIDIMEFIGDNEDTVYHTYHYYDDDGVLRSTHSEPTKGRDYTLDFHTYAADWRPGLIVFYVDGVEVHRVSDPEVSRQDMYVLLNLAMGGWWAGPPDETTPLPGRYEIDYVRVYRQVAPYEEPPQSDQPSRLAPASQVPGSSPGHRPPFELWPEGYPGGR